MVKNPVVTIVIPTYNRHDYLHRSLKFHLAMAEKAPFPIEVLVSDNASTDETPAVLAMFEGHDNLTIIRRAVNGGYDANWLTGFREARGEFIVYIGDDDFIEPAGLFNAVNAMRKDAAIVMWQAPWFGFNDQDPAQKRPFYMLDREYRFDKNSMYEALKLVLERHIFPEHAVYRRDSALRILGLHNDAAFFAFHNLGRALKLGKVVFSPEPFAAIAYGTRYEQAGHVEAMLHWDRYRGGLELLAAMVFQHIQPSEAVRAEISSWVDHFVRTRFLTAFGMNIQHRNWRRAYALYRRFEYAKVDHGLHASSIENVIYRAAMHEALLEMSLLGSSKIYVEPAITQDYIDLMPADLAARVTRNLDESNAQAPYKRAILVLKEKDFSRRKDDIVIGMDMMVEKFA